MRFHQNLRDDRQEVGERSRDQVEKEEHHAKSIQLGIKEVDETTAPGESFRLYVSSVLRDPSLGQKLLLTGEEAEALVGILWEINNPEIGHETNHFTTVSR